MLKKYLAALLESIRPLAIAIRHPPADPLAAAFESALADVGEREYPLGSNSGPYVEGLRSEVKLPRLGGGEWCAVFGSVHCWRSGIKIRSRSARKLVNLLAKMGRRVGLQGLRPGMCGLSLHSRPGGHHVRIWRCEEDGATLTIRWVGGNEQHRVKTGTARADSYVLTAKRLVTV